MCVAEVNRLDGVFVSGVNREAGVGARRERTGWTLYAWRVNPEAVVCVSLVSRLEGVCLAGVNRETGVCAWREWTGWTACAWRE